MTLRGTWTTSASLVCTLLLATSVESATLTIRPRADGTIADGGVFGPFDGVPDNSDFFFNGSSYEGAITLTTQTPESSIEHRVVFEYDLSTVTFSLPLTARLRFALRGAPIFPAADAEVHINAYPADLLEKASDFSAGPAVLAGTAVVPPYSPQTTFTIDVSGPVNEALRAGTNRIGFRFQINPATLYVNNQAFMDAVDSDPTTKPALILNDIVPGDGNGDRVVDLVDYASLSTCLSGPGIRPPAGCTVFDLDGDQDVDYRDAALFTSYFLPLP